MTGIEQLVKALGLWPGTQWLLTAFPTWLLPFVPLAATLGLWLVLKVLVEFRRPRLGKQYKGLWPGDLFLSFSLGALIIGLVYYTRPEQIGAYWRSTAWDLTTALVVVLFVGGLAVFEYSATLSDSSAARAYTLYQLHTPTCLGHRLTMVVMSYLYMKVGIPAMASVSWSFRAFALVMLALWGYCIYLDNTRPRPQDLGAIHPYDGAWFGIRRKAVPTITPAANYDNLTGDYNDPAGDSGWRNPDDDLPGGFAWQAETPATGQYDRTVDETVVDAKFEPQAYVDVAEPPAATTAPPPVPQPRRTGGYDDIRPGHQPNTGGYDNIR